MLLVSYLLPVSNMTQAIIDATLLIVVVFPVMYFCLIRPLQAHLREHDRLERMIFEIEDKEQRRIGQRLHENLGQILTGIAFQIKVLERRLEGNSPADAVYAAEIAAHMNMASNEARLIAKELLSIGSEEESLILSLKDLVYITENMSGITCIFKHDNNVPIYNKAAIIHLYRIAQEAVANAVKHGKPELIEVELIRNDDRVELKIKDNGTGFREVPDPNTGAGMQVMSYRANAIGAAIDVRSGSSEGTLVSCVLVDKKSDCDDA